MSAWLSLITSLPTENATVRMRAWRALKASGAAVLRDGVYLLPEREACRTTLDGLAVNVRNAGGTALVLRVEEPEGADFAGLFDRGEDYAALLAEVALARATLSAGTAHETLKQARKLRKTYGGLSEIDFFPGEAQRQMQPPCKTWSRPVHAQGPLMSRSRFRARYPVCPSPIFKAVSGPRGNARGWIASPVRGWSSVS